MKSNRNVPLRGIVPIYRGATRRAAIALARKLVVIVFYRWRHALHVQETLPQVEKVRERTSGAWSEHRPLASD
jgi:hypothetical protein